MCPICMENIYEKMLPKHKNFGILSSCNHAFCYSCIVTWRQMEQYPAYVRKYVFTNIQSGFKPIQTDLKPMFWHLLRRCPVCRVHSDFYLPSVSMVEGEEKERLIRSARRRCRFVLGFRLMEKHRPSYFDSMLAQMSDSCFCLWVPEKNSASLRLSLDSAPLKSGVDMPQPEDLRSVVFKEGTPLVVDDGAFILLL